MPHFLLHQSGKFTASVAVALLALLALAAPATTMAQTACASAWSSTAIYTAGQKASLNSVNYTANWWTQGNNPSTNSGPAGSGEPWTSNGACASTSCTTVSAAPVGLAATGTTSTATQLSWAAVNPPTNCAISSYTVLVNGTAIGTATGPGFTASGLQPSTAYTFTVEATDAAGTSSPSASIKVTTGAPVACTTVPSAPTGLTAPLIGSTTVQLTWNTVTPPANCSISSYTVLSNGASAGTTTTTSFNLTGLNASTPYVLTVEATDADGTSSPSSMLNVTTTAATTEGVTTGTIGFHLLLGAGSAEDSMTLAGGNYNDLIMSNMIAGVMYGHLVREGFPGIEFDNDYLYGSVMGQLLQENLETEAYVSSSNLIDPSSLQQAVMGVGQGGPYQINNYPDDMVAGSYTPEGHALINYVAIQKNIGYTIATNATQFTQPTPPSFNNKYYGPMLPAYFHYNDMVALEVIGTGTGGWITPWQPEYDEALANFDHLPNSFLDVILNVAYNQGYYGGLVASYSNLGATATASTVATVNSYSSVWGVSNSYQQYPYQVRYYLDQMYDNPIPTTSPTTTTKPANHIAFSMSALETVFTNVAESLSYSNGTAAAQFFTAAQAQSAFNAALAANKVASTASLDLSTANDRAQIFAIIDAALTNLESTSGMKFTATTTSQL
ncbi:MAG: fibronectin type III domain-containing protein [Terracidiphilus sp.]